MFEGALEYEIQSLRKNQLERWRILRQTEHFWNVVMVNEKYILDHHFFVLFSHVVRIHIKMLLNSNSQQKIDIEGQIAYDFVSRTQFVDL